MPYCSNCGKEVSANQDVCLNCGVATKQTFDVKDSGGIGWGLLGFFVPVAGLVLYLVWKDYKPRNAKAAGIGALVSLIFGIGMYILMFLFIFGAGFYFENNYCVLL